MPLQATSGAASYDGFGGGAAAVPTYIEDVFSSYLWTGDGSSAQNINNGIDLAGKGGMVWVKSRSNATTNVIVDTSRFVSSSNIQCIFSDSTSAASASANEFGSFNSNGFSIPYNTTAGWTNFGTRTFASWTFREQPKFFDVVTFTQVGTSGTQTISHNLGSVPGCIIFKAINQVDDWYTYHRSIPTQRIRLNTTAAANSSGTDVANTLTSTTFGFNVGNAGNANGTQFVAYLFAHDAGGFGLTGTDNVISCGTFTGNTTVTLGYEPQWILLKNSGGVEDWYIHDTMRGWPVSGDARVLFPNLSSAESGTAQIFPNATGFTTSIGGGTFIYIAIRRGPMKVPTLGTSVLELQNLDNLSVNTLVSSTVVPDMALHVHNLGGRYVVSRLTGGINTASSSSTSPRRWLLTSDTSAEDTGTTGLYYEMQNASFRLAGNGADPGSSLNLAYFFRRAPGFFDEVCYTGNYAGNPQVPHNLGVAPEMLIARSRVSVGQWYVKHIGMSDTEEVYFNAGALSAGPTWVRTSTYWQYSSAQYPNDAHVAYLFATCAGVSKVGSYTGTATTKQIDCGFTGGARFVLIKRTDSTGDWYVWDSARGIVAGNDPYLLLNSTAAEVTSTDYVDTYSAGFEISSTAPAAINASGGSFIFLAIA